MNNEMNDTNVRIQNASDHLADLIRNAGGGEWTYQIHDYYVNEKLVKLDMNIGRYQLTDGRLLEPDVIQRAIDIIRDMTGEW
jgi:hypothetical protein